jgi:hypothetical protein
MVKSFNPSQHTQKQKIQTAQPKRHTRIHKSLLPQTSSSWHKCCSSLQHTTRKSFCQGARTHTPNRTETKQKTQRQELLTPRNTHTHNELTWKKKLGVLLHWLPLLTFTACCFSLSASVRALKATCDIFNLAFAFDRHHLLLLSRSARTLS